MDALSTISPPLAAGLAIFAIGQTLTLVLLVGALLFGLVVFAVFARFFRLWIQSVTTGAGVGIFDLIRMTLRKVNPAIITRCKIMAVQRSMRTCTR